MTLIGIALSLNIAVFVYIWFGYLLLLKLLRCKLLSRDETLHEIQFPRVTIIVAAHNEELMIKQRIENLFDTDYPLELLSVVVASDGSTDNTLSIARSVEPKSLVTALEVFPRSGRAGAHNFAVAHLHSNNTLDGILIFTDAETIFNRDTLLELIRPFKNPKMGYVSGVLKYSNQHKSDVTLNAGLYWRFEQALRQFETDLGIFAFGTGAVCAVRSELYREVSPSGDVDFTTPLDVILQGYKCFQSQSAFAWDSMPETRKQEFRARVRMTSKNLYGTLTRWGLNGYFKHPIYSWVIWSHKIGRWLTPFIMLMIFVTTLLLLHNKYSLIFLSFQIAFYGVGIVYGLTGRGGKIASAIFNFLLANAGFFVGVIMTLFGKVPIFYSPISHDQK